MSDDAKPWWQTRPPISDALLAQVLDLQNHLDEMLTQGRLCAPILLKSKLDDKDTFRLCYALGSIIGKMSWIEGRLRELRVSLLAARGQDPTQPEP